MTISWGRTLHLVSALALGLLLLVSPQAAGQTSTGVDVAVESFGVGGAVRPGEWAGIRLLLTDSATRPRMVAVRFHLLDDDGDTALFQRPVTLNPGIQLGAWVYVRMPWSATQGDVYTVSVYEWAEDEAGPALGRQLGATRISPSAVKSAWVQLIGIVGRRTYGLTQYENNWAGSTVGRLGASHEEIDVVGGILPAGMPDYWEGLAQFDVIVWSADESPADLGTDLRPAALREWVHRGGHLVIPMPSVGAGWFAADNPVQDLLPLVEPRKLEDVSLEPFRALLTTDEFTDETLPARTTLHTFGIADDATAAEASCVITGPDGCVVVRRLVGAGMVTLVGLDVDHPGLRQAGMLRADRFWHRVLGRRFDTPTQKELRDLTIGGRQLETVFADRYVGVEIDKKTAAGVGVLLALVVFIGYWVLAGPGGFGILKMQGWQRHAWVSFIGTVGVFTAVAWLGASTLRQTSIEAQHLTFLDHVYGQEQQRARSWTSVFLPSYGEETIMLGEPGVDQRWRQVSAVWSNPNTTAEPLSFPDARPYPVDMREPGMLTVPSRATIKQFRLDWLGVRRWGTPVPAGPGNEPRLRNGDLSGVLVHDLPAALDSVLIIVVGPQRAPDRVADRDSGPMWADVVYWRRPTAWAPGIPLDLGALSPDDANTGDDLRTFVPRASGMGFMGTENNPTSLSPSEADRDYERAALVSMLPPPDYKELRQQTAIRIRDAHGWDLGKWFTQPCVIIIGHLRDAELPSPLQVVRGDTVRPIPSEGHTVLRWIYPLTPDPLEIR